MSYAIIDESLLTGIADAIREKNGSSDTYTPAQMATAIGAMASGGLEYETGTYAPESDIAKPFISFSKSHDYPPCQILFYDATNTIDIVTSSNWLFQWIDFSQISNTTISYSETSVRYAIAFLVYRGSQTTSLTSVGSFVTYPYSDTGDSANTYYRFWVTASGFYPYTNSTSRYWRSGRTYKWIAVWKP